MAKGDIISRLKLESGEFDAKIKRAGQELLAYSEHCKKMGLEMGYANRDAKDFAKALGSMATVSNTARGKINELSEAFVNAKVMYKNMTDEEKKGEFGKNLAASLDQLKTRLNAAKQDLADVNKELAGNSKFGDFGKVLDTVGNKLGLTTSATELLTSKTALLTGAVGAGIAVVTKATEAWAAYNQELARQDQITTVTTGLKGEDADRMTDTMRALSDTYKVDFREAINAANTLMSQFGMTGDAAIQIIKDGMQGMIMGDGPKLLSMIQQYAPAFRDAGVSASQLVAVIQNSEGGIFTDQNMNAIVFGIKNIRLMTKATSDALAQLGIDGEKMSKQLSDGTLTIFDALKQVAAKLQNVESGGQQAGEVMQAVFGRQGTMAGTNLAKAIASLNTNLEETKRQTGEVGESFAQLQLANERLNKAIRDCFEYDGWDKMANGIKSELITALADVLDITAQIKNSWIGSLVGTIFDPSAFMATLKPLNTILSIIKEIRSGIGDSVKTSATIGNAVGGVTNSIKGAVGNATGILGGIADEVVITPNHPIKTKKTGNGKNTKETAVKTEEQLNSDAIQKLTQEYVKASDERREAIIEEIAVLKQRNEEIQKLKDEAVGNVKIAAPEGSMAALTEELKTLQAEQQKVTSPEGWQKYALAIEGVKTKMYDLQGIQLPGLGNPDEAQAKVEEQVKTIQEFIKAGMGKGVVGMEDIGNKLMARMFNPDDIDPATIEDFLAELKEQFGDLLSEEDFAKIKIAIETGDLGPIEEYNKKLQDNAKKTSDSWKNAASSIGQLGNALQNIEDPGVKAVGTVIQAVASAALGFAQASKGPFTNPWEWIAFAASGLATMITMISTIHSATGMKDGGIVGRASGGFVPGQSYSGDNILANDGSLHLDSGELILNRAQQGVIASSLEGGGFQNMQLEAVVEAEDLKFVLNSNGRRTMKGEFVQSRNYG